MEYRLSIYHARVNDTGTYTCSTPFQQEHTIKILVKEVKVFSFCLEYHLNFAFLRRDNLQAACRPTFLFQFHCFEEKNLITFSPFDVKILTNM